MYAGDTIDAAAAIAVYGLRHVWRQANPGDLVQITGVVHQDAQDGRRKLQAERVTVVVMGGGRFALPVLRAAALDATSLRDPARSMLMRNERPVSGYLDVATAEVPARVRFIAPASGQTRGDVMKELKGTESCLLQEWTASSFHDASQLAEAIRQASDCDLIAVHRGGGGWRDWYVLSQPELLNAIAESPIPVAVGLGHFDDHPLASHVAVSSSTTPTKLGQVIARWSRRMSHMPRRPTGTTLPSANSGARSASLETRVRDLRREIADLRSEHRQQLDDVDGEVVGLRRQLSDERARSIAHATELARRGIRVKSASWVGWVSVTTLAIAGSALAIGDWTGIALAVSLLAIGATAAIWCARTERRVVRESPLSAWERWRTRKWERPPAGSSAWHKRMVSARSALDYRFLCSARRDGTDTASAS